MHVTDDAINEAHWLRIRTWRAKAEELRNISDGVKSDETRRLLGNAAANYDRLADEAEARGRPEASLL